ncbi:MAG: 2-oxoglutarate dehydrogenase E1 component [Planctomycetes bacterium]|nr:2-oxoglutarate dehydrogenase E1 component [Planctomycetota bacterium]
MLDAFRRWGYLQANLDPLGRLAPAAHPDLDVSGPEADAARHVYCGSIGVEFMHMPHPERCRWICEKMESAPPAPDRARILDFLVRADTLERTIQTTYVGTKRFSLEGNDALIPLLDEGISTAAERGLEIAIIGMSHRGRLNVIVQIVDKDPAGVFGRFEDVDPRSVLGGGDVKYHLGATGTHETRGGRKVHVRLGSNPSHLEAIVPVVLGRVRARQSRIGEEGPKKVVPFLLHGDAAFAGQGIVAEAFNFADLPAHSVGGTVHVVVNNLIGFTTEPRSLHSSRYSTDVAKRLDIPIFHVNGQDPDAVVRVARMATEYRYEFGTDVVIDLIGYRRHGHSEVDDPTATQPVLYRKIESLPPLWKRYAEDVAAAEEAAARYKAVLQEAKRHAEAMTEMPGLYELPEYWRPYHGGRASAADRPETAVPAKRIEEVALRMTEAPPGFAFHPKVKRLLDQRREMGRGSRPVDWGSAEMLAFGTLLLDGVRVRLTGQDSRRGTFNQRHAALVDHETGAEHLPLARVGAPFEVFDSTLSEAAVLGFEYGFSRDFPEALVLWEAQFGDFANGAQIVIDQFVAAAEDKWKLLSGLVMLLPHGYEGQGPEHSSARIERFLQLAGEDNMVIAQPSTAAQHFHLLRLQGLRKWRKPLVVFTPKSVLRHPEVASPLSEFTAGGFRPVLPDPDVRSAARVLVCSGKIGHELRDERRKRGDETAAIVMLDQLYPFPERELAEALAAHAAAREVVWVQEEPANMGALSFVLPHLERLVPGLPVRSIKRSASASPATGSAKAHAMEQATLLALAFDTTSTRAMGRDVTRA